MKGVYRRLRISRPPRKVSTELQSDLVFCPFTIPTFWRPGVPCISIVYDLQHLTYPEFFSPEQRLNRQRHIEEAVARAERVVSISEYVRRTLLASTAQRPDRAVTIPLGLLNETVVRDPTIVDRLGLEPGRFLLYPANFWPHKNHRRLFEALRIYRHTHADAQLRLVCTGTPNKLMQTLAAEAPPELVVIAGYASERELASLFDACAALVFPSLYEGFGMPVLEAMAHGKPVLCSNVTSLPEVAGDAATYFDPTDVRQIASAIESLGNASKVADLVRRGRHRAAGMGTGREMAMRYLEQFDEVLAARVRA